MREFPTGASGLRRLRRLARDSDYRADSGTSVVEGPVLVGEAIEAGRDVRLVVAPTSMVGDPIVSDLLARAAALGIESGTVVDRAFAGLTSTRSPQPAVAEVAHHDVDPEVLVGSVRPGRPLLVLAELADPGNVGTLFRSAEAFDAAGVLVAGGVDPYNPKVVRAAAGSSFRLPFARMAEAFEAIDLLAAAGVEVWAAVPCGGAPVVEVPVDRAVALVLGNEPRGLSEELVVACAGSATVATVRGVESLNVAVAGSVALYEMTRDRVRYAGSG